MNRLFAEAAPPQTSHTTLTQVEHSLLRTANHRGAPQTLFTPQHYEPNYAYPLVVWLHGKHGDERQLQKVMPLISMRNYAAVGVRGPMPALDRGGYYWPQTDDAIQLAEQRIFEAVEYARDKFNIDPRRVFIAGYECGGTMALRMALRNPRRCAAALSLGGSFPTGRAPLANLARLRKFPLFIAHSRDSVSYPVERLCDELTLFHSAGLSVSLRQYPCGDELTTQMLHDADVWMMEHVTGISAASNAEEVIPRDCN
jgi:phospholipase/carboxylesterase